MLGPCLDLNYLLPEQYAQLVLVQGVLDGSECYLLGSGRSVILDN